MTTPARKDTTRSLWTLPAADTWYACAFLPCAGSQRRAREASRGSYMPRAEPLLPCVHLHVPFLGYALPLRAKDILISIYKQLFIGYKFWRCPSITCMKRLRSDVG